MNFAEHSSTPARASRSPESTLGPALLEAHRGDLDLHGVGQLFGPARLEEACAEGLGVGGGAPCGEANGFGRREVAVQQTGEESGEIGVAAPHRRDGLDPWRTRRDGAVLGAEVGEALGGGDTSIRGPELDEPCEAERKIPFLDKVEADDALGLVLVRAYERGFALSAALSTDGGESTTV